MNEKHRKEMQKRYEEQRMVKLENAEKACDLLEELLDNSIVVGLAKFNDQYVCTLNFEKGSSDINIGTDFLDLMVTVEEKWRGGEL